MAASTTTTSSVCINVIEGVINKMRDEFVNSGGPGESVLNELQGMWEMKMMQAGVICSPIQRSATTKSVPGGSITPVHDLNVPYEGTEEYETPTADMLFPPTPLQTPIQTPLPGSSQTPLPGSAQTPLPGTVQTPLPGSVDNSSMYNISTGPTGDYPTPVSDTGGSAEGKPGRPSPYMQPPAWINQRSPLSVDVNVAYVEGRDEADRGISQQPLTQDFFTVAAGKRKREDFAARYNNNGGSVPQQDGASDLTSDFSQAILVSDSVGRCGPVAIASRQVVAHVSRFPLKIPQLDGSDPDPYDDALSTPNIYNYQGVVNEDYNIANTPAPNDIPASTPAVASQNDSVDDDDEPLNEDDDDDEDADDVDEGEEMNTQHLVLAQFEKVTRTKSRWKCTLKDGIMHINNKDILFNKASGEFDF